jgi:hypothetical protein
MTQSGPELDRNPALQRATDSLLANALCLSLWLGAADAIRSIEKARIHRTKAVPLEWTRVGAAAWPVASRAQELAGKIPRIGFLQRARNENVVAFVQACARQGTLRVRMRHWRLEF